MDQIKLRTFESQILYFNGMYKLPVAAYPTVYTLIESERKQLAKKLGSAANEINSVDVLINRLKNFKSIVSKEISEVDEIITRLQTGKHLVKDEEGNEHWVEYTELDCLVDLADWLGDIQVYCASEMAKYGIPITETKRIIMSSNFSKLDAKGQPIYDDEGKVQKGPMYWKPEPRIKAMLAEKIEEAILANRKEENGIVWNSAK